MLRLLLRHAGATVAAIALLLGGIPRVDAQTRTTLAGDGGTVAPTLLSDCDITVQSCGTDGGELYYRAPGGAIMSVGVALGATAALSPPRVAVADPRFSRTVRGLDVTPDGERFIAFARGDPPVLTLVVDWAARLARP